MGFAYTVFLTVHCRSNIMATIPFFGDAVHAVLPYLERGNRPEAIPPGEFIEVLATYMPRMASFTPLELERIRSIWLYVSEIVSYADEILFEEDMGNGRRPDLALRHRHHVYVIELKASRPFAKVWPKEAARVREQVIEAARLLANKLGRSMPVHGYKLMFSNDSVRDMDPLWIKLCTIRN
jgi:hypothetical protein